MLQILSHLDWIAIGLAFFVYSFLGYFWFTILFEKLYRTSLGKENETPESLAFLFVFGPMVCMLIITITTAVLFSVLQVQQTIDALVWGSLFGFGFLTANTFNIAINPNIPRPILYGAISSAYHLVGINIASFLLIQRF
ncbi:DUF1761 domain-containing protein [Leptospira harrisiae]|uniref:DUF1761 domain-containing protein n=1 Tax=Leptospira harrisiae TaxID=2023189 RepID=A0A2N0AKB5_9LEPT|nr:DUF1761 domain-containing protein [Leptospira harrisiae]PJZ84661.1 hypothetical protein CH364_11700 [Leptospira harrisiae]PKA07401.1 hypothetical protein CH366_13400 [Leptospira harrisiae]